MDNKITEPDTGLKSLDLENGKLLKSVSSYQADEQVNQSSSFIYLFF